MTLAQAGGLLTPLLAGVLYALYDASDERLSVTWWGEPYIARLVHGSANYDDREAGARTAGAWMAELKKLGWVQAIQRMVHVEGRLHFTTNAWRLVIPAPLRSEVEALEDAARAKSSSHRARPGRVTPGSQGRPFEPQRAPSPAHQGDVASPGASDEPLVDVGAQIAASRAALVEAAKRAPPDKRPPRR